MVPADGEQIIGSDFPANKISCPKFLGIQKICCSKFF
jgi:hypothetical protein